MKLSLQPVVRVAAALSLAAVMMGCTAEAEDGAMTNEDAVTATRIDPASPEGLVRRYYGAASAATPATDLNAIVADDAVLEAPSVYLFNPFGGTDKIRGKQAFVKAVSGAAFLLKSAQVAPAGRPADASSGVALAVLTPSNAPSAMVMSRILLPLPNGDTLTQVEFFRVEDGKIVELKSYYDSARFARAIPAIGVQKLKDSFKR